MYQENSFTQFCCQESRNIQLNLERLVIEWIEETLSIQKGLAVSLDTLLDGQHQLARGKAGYACYKVIAHNTDTLQLYSIVVKAGGSTYPEDLGDSGLVLRLQRDRVNELYQDWLSWKAISLPEKKIREEVQIIAKQKEEKEIAYKAKQLQAYHGIWDNARKIDKDNPYLHRKKLGIISQEELPSLRYLEGKIGNEEGGYESGKIILAKIEDVATGKTIGYQEIWPKTIADQNKKIIGKKKGGIVVIHDPQWKMLPFEIILLAEGIATAISIYLSLRDIFPQALIASCLDCGNMDDVVAGLKNRYSFLPVPIILCADDDLHHVLQGKKNAGLSHAEAAAQKYSCWVIKPQFDKAGINRETLTPEEIKAKYTDYNDLYQVNPAWVRNEICLAIQDATHSQQNEEIKNIDESNAVAVEKQDKMFGLNGILGAIKYSIIPSSSFKRPKIMNISANMSTDIILPVIANSESSRSVSIFSCSSIGFTFPS